MKLALAGDTMLGRKVAEALRSRPAESLVSDEVVAVAREADLFVLNLECCVSERGERWPDPRKPFFFRAPPSAVDLLAHLRVDCVTLANNHALDYGPQALVDTLDLLHAAGIATVGAGRDLEEARAPAILRHGDQSLAVLGLTDHPADFAAGEQPGVAFADLWHGRAPSWLLEAVAAPDADAVLVTPHWGPNMSSTPLPHVRNAAHLLLEAGATLVAGHSAHLFQGVRGPILYDLGDFLDDYAVDPLLRNDLGLLFLVDLDPSGPVRLQAVPIELRYCHTQLAQGEEAAWIRRRFSTACREFGTEVTERDGRLLIEPLTTTPLPRTPPT
ncbi:MAG: CapA family protein [Actinomycetota bacterium]|nr:CapA family protein [Actinomycetota bacterium]